MVYSTVCNVWRDLRRALLLCCCGVLLALSFVSLAEARPTIPNATLINDDVVIRIKGGSNIVLEGDNFFRPERVATKLTKYYRGRIGEFLSNYRKILRLNKRKPIPHYDVEVEFDGEVFHGLLVFFVPSRGSAAKRTYRLEIAKAIPQGGLVAHSYGYQHVPASAGLARLLGGSVAADIPTWALWYSDLPLK